MSLDGYIDDASDQRLLLSNEQDFDRADEVRAWSDAILVGAGTVRADNPRLLIRSEHRRRDRVAQDRSEHPIKATWTLSGNLALHGNFFQLGDAPKRVYCPQHVATTLKAAVGSAAEVVGMASNEPGELLTDLWNCGVRRLLVEGGEKTNTAFLKAGVVDELHLSVAPFLIGDSRAPRWCGDGPFPYSASRPMRLTQVAQLGDVVELRYTVH